MEKNTCLILALTMISLTASSLYGKEYDKEAFHTYEASHTYEQQGVVSSEGIPLQAAMPGSHTPGRPFAENSVELFRDSGTGLADRSANNRGSSVPASTTFNPAKNDSSAGSTDRGTDAVDTDIQLDAGDIERRAQLVNLRYDEKNGSIRLDDTVLIEDDAPAVGVPEGYESYRSGPVAWVEDLKNDVVVKKILHVDNPAAHSARVVFKGLEVQDNSEPLHFSLNGVEFVRPATRFAYPDARQYIDLRWSRWFYVEVPAGALRQGENELLMWAESDSTSWRVLIAHEQEFERGSLTRTQPPNRSMKSSDGGRSWSDSQLGALDEINGEYAVRLSLDQYLPSGEYISPLVDVVDGEDVLKHNADDVRFSMMPELDVPEGTAVDLSVRYGSTPFIGDESWTDWKPLEAGQEYEAGDKRYMQWSAGLTTENPLQTPQIHGVRLQAGWENHSPETHRVLSTHVRNNGEIMRSSYPFGYEDFDHPGLRQFREDHRLDQVIGVPSSEFDLMMRLLNWAYRVPLTHEAYSWNYNEMTEIERLDDGMPLLKGPEDFGGRRMIGMCLYPNQVLMGALLSYGHQARHINIHSEGISGHEVVEVWSNEHNKWIYMDATRDYYYYDPDTGTPLNLLEVHDLLAEQMPRAETWKNPFAPDIGDEVISRIEVGMREGDNPYSIEEDGRSLMKTMGHFRITPRNDFLSNPRPVPVRTGATMWGWDGFLNWYDEVFPKRYEYQRYTNRASDFYEPLNQAKLFLNQTDEPGKLKVHIDTFTPGGFDAFMVRIDDDSWEPLAGSEFEWNLRSGLNTIEVKSRNVRGVAGPVSHIDVAYNP